MHQFIQDTIDVHKHNLQDKFSDEEPKDFIEAYIKEICNTKDKTSSFYLFEGGKS